MRNASASLALPCLLGVGGLGLEGVGVGLELGVGVCGALQFFCARVTLAASWLRAGRGKVRPRLRLARRFGDLVFEVVDAVEQVLDRAALQELVDGDAAVEEGGIMSRGRARVGNDPEPPDRRRRPSPPSMWLRGSRIDCSWPTSIPFEWGVPRESRNVSEP